MIRRFARPVADHEPQPARRSLLVLPWELHHPGGVVQVLHGLYRAMRAAGHEPDVVVSTWDCAEPVPGESGGLPVWRWQLRSPWEERLPLYSLLAFLMTFPRRALLWRRFSAENAWEVVNAHYPSLAMLFFVLTKWLRLWSGKIILSIHGLDIRGAARTRGIERILWTCLIRAADAVVAPCRELAEDASAAFPIPRGRLHVIPNGVDPEAIRDEQDRDFAIPPALASARYVACVATFEHKKGQDVLVRAFARLQARHPDLHLVLAGRATETLPGLRALVDELGVADRVHIFENVPHARIPAFLERATVFCLPSRAEGGNPLAILEAGVFGLPVVACPVGGVPEMIEHGRHGILVQPEDEAALEYALGTLFDDDALRAQLGEALRERVLREFTWDRAACDYLEIIGPGRRSDHARGVVFDGVARA